MDCLVLLLPLGAGGKFLVLGRKGCTWLPGFSLALVLSHSLHILGRYLSTSPLSDGQKAPCFPSGHPGLSDGTTPSAGGWR